MNKISFCATFLNEEKNIASLLDSILNQSIKPNEIILVDGGSKDKTCQIIKEYQKKSRIPIKLIISKGANIAKGRNIYLKESKYPIIFSGDASTTFEKNWIKKMMKGFEKGADIVVGKYLPAKPFKNAIEEIIAARMPDFDSFTEEDFKEFLPSNRQIAFKKESWKRLGKFPEYINRADDTLMHMKAKKLGLKYYFAKDAVVRWHARDNLWQYLKIAFLDSKSDGISGIVFKRKIYWLQLATLTALITSFILGFFNPLFLTIALFIILAIIIKEGLKIYSKTKKPKLFLYGGIVSFLLFLAHSTGAIIGLIKRKE